MVGAGHAISRHQLDILKRGGVNYAAVIICEPAIFTGRSVVINTRIPSDKGAQ